MTDHIVGAASASHVGDFLSDYLNGGLGEADRQAVEAHLRECPRCMADLRTLRLTVGAVRRLPLAPVPRSFAIPAATRASTPVTNFLSWSTRALAAALVLFLAIGLIRPIVAPESASNPLTGNSPAAAPIPPQLATGTPNDQVKRAALAQQVARATATALAQVAASTPTPAAAAAPASAPAAAPASAPAPSLALSPAKSNGSTTAQPPAAAAAKAPAAVPTPFTARYPGDSPVVITTPLPSELYPSVNSNGRTVAPATARYPAPTAAPPARPVSTGPTTWFTPALVLLLLLAVVSAVAMSWLSRRGR